MLLLDATTLKLEHFDNPPEYAAISHRWREQEVQFNDIQTPHAPSLRGYTKLVGCCAQAVRDGYTHVWIDTCCINKSSSAELSEAINSMYTWYRSASVCYAYLDDVSSDEDPKTEGSSFERSEWFTRGWTLQELLAPESVFFFGADWTLIGSKYSLMGKIAKITGISEDVLLSARSDVALSIATRMSWAAGRKTTKPEDRAYSLMGIFNVHMPIIYGEGERKAFARLQYEIMRSSNDQSIFAWRYPLSHGSFSYSPLAYSPDLFADCRGIHCIPTDMWVKHCQTLVPGSVPHLHFALTNQGIHITLPLRQIADNKFIALLNCVRYSSDRVLAGAFHASRHHPSRVVGIHLRQSMSGIEHYERIDGDVVENVDIYNPETNSPGFILREIHIGEHLTPLPTVPLVSSIAHFIIQIIGIREAGFQLTVNPASGCTLESTPREDGSLVMRMRRPYRSPMGQTKVVTINFDNTSGGESFEALLGMWWDSAAGGGPSVFLGAVGIEDRKEYQDQIRRPGEDSWPYPNDVKRRIDWATLELGDGKVVSAAVRKGGKLLFGESRSLMVERHLVTIQLRQSRSLSATSSTVV